MALMPVLKTLLITAVGLYLAVERVNLLGMTARHNLNNVVFYVFTPALIASSLADTITASNLSSLWFMPANILLTFIIGSALGWILVRITPTPEHLHGLVIGCCSAGNLGNLLLIIIPAVCQEKNSPFGDFTTCSTNGQAYVSLSMAMGAVYIWSYVYNTIRVYGSCKNNIIEDMMGVNSTITTDCSASDISSESCTQALLQSFKDYEAQSDHQPLLYITKVPSYKKIMKYVNSLIENVNWKMVFTPSTIATIIGFVIGVVSPIRLLMIGDTAPFRVIDSSASMLGEATIPCMTLIVGANLLKGLKNSGVGLFLIIGILVVRYVALPVIGIGIVKCAHHLGWVGSDSLYLFVLMLQYALPPAMAIGTITQLFEVGESECSVIMLWTYVVASLSLTLWVTFYMWLLS